MSAFDDWFARMMPDAEAWAAQFAAEPVVARPNVVPMDEPLPARDGFLVPPGLADALLEAVKLSAIINVPDELLTDYGAIPDTRPKPPPLPWRWRLRNRISDWRGRTARRAYRIIAGEWPDSGEDDW